MKIPKEIKNIVEKLKESGFEIYIVGGCIRDLLRKKKPKDWDIATNAKPKEISDIFKKHYINNEFGTVTVLTNSRDESLKEVEITPYRTEEQYSDKRHPDKIHWAETVEEDLSRRDFTVNAMAAEILKGEVEKIIDPFNGQADLEKKIIKAVRDPKERFSEDALRMMRAVRFATVMDFEIEDKTSKAIKDNSSLLKEISNERVRDELIKIIMSEKAAKGIDLLRELDLLQYILPELLEGYKISQNKHHIYDVYEHSLRSLKYAAEQGYNKYVRIAALLHDIGKPRSKEGEGEDATFYNHEMIGAEMTHKILTRLRFSKKDLKKIRKLVRYHLFYYHPDEVGESSVRKLVRQVGSENIEELIQLRKCDRVGSGCPKAEPYKLRYLKYVIEKVSQDPVSVKMLKLSGEDIMKTLGINPSPMVGQVLDILLGLVLDDPKRNKKDFLENEVKKIANLSESDLREKAKEARKKREEIEIKRDEMTKKKYWVS